MRSSTCREIERACKKISGWMEVEHPAAGPDTALQTEITSAPGAGDEVEIPQYKGTGGSMGGGVTLRDQPGEIHGWRVTPEWISKNIKNHSGAGNLCIVTGFGNSMQPLYNPGDPLILDRGIKSVEFDATYFFRVGDEGFIKILQRIPGEGIRVISKNKDYETWTIKPDMDFEVFGQVLKAWCGTDV
ncbi:MAG: helix-turn-helix transcriptional regulator [Burkholderiaceae bacterium]|nr:helix-turn-helix transcriptional regulator [Burkholderiaceae bacterium]